MNDPLRDDRFDAAMRARYHAAADALPMRLRVALREAPAPRAAWWAHWQWPAGLATAMAVGLVAFTLQRAPQPAKPPVATNAANAASPSPSPASADPLALDPDFYAWLASSDAQQLAME
ncbi:hypothetical protein DCD74_01295 [Lysobacter oculi]|uniref:Uncharacterized protein n=1 Tax=Solilutibacter oculi TaxID=2698682 RepID=A0A344J397_9GAMM|nr:hypothetical protein [Lysobacter oculi]AXA83507.1 hypothetical protein DCD74_01295 [Lysobacter oculi]